MVVEKRKAARESTFQPVWLLVESYGAMTMRDAFLLDSSPFGIRIQTGIPLNLRQVVGYLPGADLVPPLRCEVKWVGQYASGHQGEAGLEFVVPN